MTDIADAPPVGRSLADRVRADFPILRAEDVYLDNAATVHKPRAVLDAMTTYYSTLNSNVGRGYHRLAHASAAAFEQARRTVAEAIGAAADEVVFTSGTTDSVNLLADTVGRGLVGRGDAVLVSGSEHNSNLLPWRRLCESAGADLLVAPVDDRGVVDEDGFAALVGPGVRLVAFSHVSNVLGTVNPVAELARRAHRHGAVVVVDGAQAVPHRRVDVRALGADFYCFSGHKVYGPMGIGVLWGRRELLSELPPYRVGGGTVQGVEADAPVRYVPAPARLEAGTPHVAGAVGLAAAFSYLDRIGPDAVREHDAELVRLAVSQLSALDRVHVVGEPAQDPCGIVSLHVEGIHPYDVGSLLDEHRIAVRCGVHCASTFLDSLGLVGTVRLSFAVYNSPAELDRVAEVLATAEPGYWTRELPTTRFL